MFVAKKGDTVKVHYTGYLADGTVFDSSQDKQPLNFILGQKEVIAGFDAAIVGMVPGEHKTLTIPPEQAYGASNPDLIEEIDRAQLPADLALQIGAQIEITRQDGSLLYVMVSDLNDEQVTLDANHPLAGKALTFDIHLIEVIPEAQQNSQPGGILLEQLKKQRQLH
ncbi:MAG: peptidylprolyl isomerase [Desulfuromonas sp.]